MGERVFKKDVGKITTRPGEVFFLELEGHPSAGYVWQVDVDDESKLQAVEVDAVVGPGIGAESKQRFRFEPSLAGTCQIRLTYGRPWEEEPVESRKVEVEVKAGEQHH